MSKRVEYPAPFRMMELWESFVFRLPISLTNGSYADFLIELRLVTL
jgi:hypothetical protein